jgi:UDP-N-acetylglucosamine--N-acetylmuramyl-(pentapeptide) pyrophosphoryl-undecaprenol N-acetylglucosamine transferase
MRPYKFILSGGGTGGHIYPAIAIANELKLRFAEFLFVEPKINGNAKVPQAGYAIKGLWIAGQRQINLKNAMFPSS